jgi:hypothetical protein
MAEEPRQPTAKQIKVAKHARVEGVPLESSTMGDVDPEAWQHMDDHGKTWQDTHGHTSRHDMDETWTQTWKETRQDTDKHLLAKSAVTVVAEALPVIISEEREPRITVTKASLVKQALVEEIKRCRHTTLWHIKKWGGARGETVRPHDIYACYSCELNKGTPCKYRR